MTMNHGASSATPGTRGSLTSRHVPGQRQGIGWRWVVALVLASVPLLIAVIVILIGGWNAPFLSFGLAGLPFTAITLPSVLPRLFGQSGRLWFRPDDPGVVLPDLGIERLTYGVTALAAIAAPWLVRWDLSRSDTTLPTLTAIWLWLLPPLGIAGLIWLRRPRTTALHLLDRGIVIQTSTDRHELSWDQVPEFTAEASDRLLAGFQSIGIRFPALQLRSDPDVVADVLEFYRTHPDLRSEIGTDAFIARLSAGNLGAAV